MESSTVPRLVVRRRPRSPVGGRSNTSTVNNYDDILSLPSTSQDLQNTNIPTIQQPTETNSEQTVTNGNRITLLEPSHEQPIETSSQTNDDVEDSSSVEKEQSIGSQPSESNMSMESAENSISPEGTSSEANVDFSTSDILQSQYSEQEALIPLDNGINFRIRHKPLIHENAVPMRIESVEVIQNDRKRSYSTDEEEDIHPKRPRSTFNHSSSTSTSTKRVHWDDDVPEPLLENSTGALEISAHLTVWKYCQEQKFPLTAIGKMLGSLTVDELIKLATAIHIFYTQDYNSELSIISNASSLLSSIIEIIPTSQQEDFTSLHEFLKKIKTRPDNDVFSLLGRHKTQAELDAALAALSIETASPRKIIFAVVSHLVAGVVKSFVGKPQDLSEYK